MSDNYSNARRSCRPTAATWGGRYRNWVVRQSLGGGIDGGVTALTVFDDGTGPALYAVGSFNTARGVSTNRIAEWNGSAWSPLGSGLVGGNPSTTVSALVVFDDGMAPVLYAGGRFTRAGGKLSARIAAWRRPDCNANGVPDESDIAAGTSLDANGNGIPDECEVTIPTVSEWGLIAMTLLVLVTGTLILRRGEGGVGMNEKDWMRQSRSMCAVAAVLCIPGIAGAQPCPIVDRGSPVDGVTTIVVINPEALCTGDPLFDGWNCLTLQSNANPGTSGVHYGIDVRWNRVDQPVRGSFTWLKGGDSTESIRATAPPALQIQDTLDTVDQIRTIELRFLGAGTATPPRNGFPNISSVYADVLEWLVTNGTAEGVIGHYGNSGGSMIGAANALAYHRLDQVLDGVVFGGGPFFTDLFLTCADPTSPIFANDSVRSRVDQWSWLELGGAPFCFDMSPQSEPPYECRSTLGVEADTEYPDVMVSVLIGINDINNPWIDAAAMDYWQRITASSKTFDRPDAPHLVVASTEGAEAVYQRITEIVNAASEPAVPTVSEWGMVVMTLLLCSFGTIVMRRLNSVRASGTLRFRNPRL